MYKFFLGGGGFVKSTIFLKHTYILEWVGYMYQMIKLLFERKNNLYT
jgi:hypothetical protein